VVGEIADRVAVLEAGAIVEQGPTASLFQHPEHKTTRLLLGLGESSKNHYER
jgi:ABC-type dipeptide/oligopeptide/nickel transport system ATPase component